MVEGWDARAALETLFKRARMGARETSSSARESARRAGACENGVCF